MSTLKGVRERSEVRSRLLEYSYRLVINQTMGSGQQTHGRADLFRALALSRIYVLSKSGVAEITGKIKT